MTIINQFILKTNCNIYCKLTHHHPAPPHQTGNCHQTCSDLHKDVKHSASLELRINYCIAMIGLRRAAALTTDLAPWHGDARWVALAFVSVLEQSLLQLFHFLLLPLELLQPALLLWFTEMLLQWEFAGRFINLLMHSQVGFQHLQLSIL